MAKAVLGIIGGSGIGFAIPSNLAQTVADQLLTNGKVRRAWLGVSFQELTPELAKGLGKNDTHGALVADVVNGGPAAKGGVRAGDIIPADVKLLTGTLSVDQSALTGESKDADKSPNEVLSSGSVVRRLGASRTPSLMPRARCGQDTQRGTRLDGAIPHGHGCCAGRICSATTVCHRHLDLAR